MKKILIAVSAFALFAVSSGAVRADEGKALPADDRQDLEEDDQDGQGRRRHGRDDRDQDRDQEGRGSRQEVSCSFERPEGPSSQSRRGAFCFRLWTEIA